jgi:hypothetical protein
MARHGLKSLGQNLTSACSGGAHRGLAGMSEHHRDIDALSSRYSVELLSFDVADHAGHDGIPAHSRSSMVAPS